MNKKYIIVTLLILGFLVAPLILKMWYIEIVINHETGQALYGAVQVFLNDSIVYFLILLLVYLSCLSCVHYSIAIILRVIVMFVFAAYLIDFYVVLNFNNRLVLMDVIKYSSYAFNYLMQIQNRKEIVSLIIILVGLFLSIRLIFNKVRVNGKIVHLCFVTNISFMLVLFIFVREHNVKYVHSWLYQNYINYNLMVLSERKPYSEGFVNRFVAKESRYCHRQAAANKNVILLMVESLSAYQSDYFSNIKSWTPGMDSIARNNTAFTNFYANGFTTEDGEISMLTGKLPIYAPANLTNGGGTSFQGFYNVTEALPGFFNKNGYTTEFLTTADLSFANTGAWAKSNGFDYVEGHENDYYNDWERSQFEAAPDEALFNRVIQRIESQGSNKHFIFIKSVSSHHPFVNPENKKKSEEEVFRYVDRQVERFYQYLERINYFNDGILIVVGDHHSMVPLKKKEYLHYGAQRAPAMVPLIIVGWNDEPQIIDEAYQQVDIFNGLKNMTESEKCFSNWQGDVFVQQPAKFIAHRRGDNRNIISVFSDDVDYTVMLDGDQTRITNLDRESNKVEDIILNKINSVRLEKK